MGLVVVGHELPDQAVQFGYPCNAFGEAGFGKSPPGPILDLHVVVIFSPIIADEQHLDVLHFRSTTRSAACRKTRDLMVKCYAKRRATTSHQRFAFLATEGGTI